MIINDRDETIFKNFSLWYPNFAELTERWEPSGTREIIAYLSDGRVISYDDIENTFRQIHNIEQPIDLTDEEKVAQEFSYNLNRMMNLREITQLELSEMSGVSQVSISKYLNLKASPTLKNISLLADALQCRVTDLLNF